MDISYLRRLTGFGKAKLGDSVVELKMDKEQIKIEGLSQEHKEILKQYVGKSVQITISGKDD